MSIVDFTINVLFAYFWWVLAFGVSLLIIGIKLDKR